MDFESLSWFYKKVVGKVIKRSVTDQRVKIALGDNDVGINAGSGLKPRAVSPGHEAEFVVAERRVYYVIADYGEEREAPSLGDHLVIMITVASPFPFVADRDVVEDHVYEIPFVVPFVNGWTFSGEDTHGNGLDGRPDFKYDVEVG